MRYVVDLASFEVEADNYEEAIEKAIAILEEDFKPEVASISALLNSQIFPNISGVVDEYWVDRVEGK